MRVLGALLVVLGVGCSAEDPPFYRGPGVGSHGTTVEAPDADPSTLPDANNSTLTGVVCVIQDWSAPSTCPAITASHDVLIEDLASGGASTTSDGTGAFSLDLLNPIQAVLRAGGATGDVLESTQSVVAAADSPIDLAAVDQNLWESTLANLAETQTTGAGVVFVVDPSGPVASATLVFSAGTPVGSRTYYDDGAGGFDLNAVSTGNDGAVLLLDIPTAGIQVSTGDGRSGSAILATGTGEVGIAVITLPAAP